LSEFSRLFSLTRRCRGGASGNHARKWGVAIYALKKTDTDQEHRGHRGHRAAIQHSDAPDAPYGPDAVLGRGANSLQAKQPTASEPPMVPMPKENRFASGLAYECNRSPPGSARSRRRTHGRAKGWLFPKIAPGTTGKSAFLKWFGRYIGAHGITDGTRSWTRCAAATYVGTSETPSRAGARRRSMAARRAMPATPSVSASASESKKPSVGSRWSPD
jgi:hypothetical protein